jgi:preprotein translocase subunit SecF
VLGTGPLKDLALALFVGMAAGTYSSIFIATPLVSQLKEHEPAMKAQATRVLARRAKVATGVPVTAGSATPSRTVQATGAAKRAQPSRKPRSQRGRGGS